MKRYRYKYVIGKTIFKETHFENNEKEYNTLKECKEKYKQIVNQDFSDKLIIYPNLKLEEFNFEYSTEWRNSDPTVQFKNIYLNILRNNNDAIEYISLYKRRYLK